MTDDDKEQKEPRRLRLRKSNEGKEPRRLRPQMTDDEREPGSARPQMTDDEKEPNAAGSRLPQAAKPRRVSMSASVAELKAKLAARGVDYSGCVEKEDLQALWLRSFSSAAAAAAAADAVRRSAQDSPPPWNEPWQTGAVPRRSFGDAAARRPSTGDAPDRRQSFGDANVRRQSFGEVPQRRQSFGDAAPRRHSLGEMPQSLREEREQDTRHEVARILRLRQAHFPTAASWSFAVLGVPPGQRDAASAQRAYRSLMKQLHPDKVEQTEGVAKAVELVREARETAERSFSRLQAPDRPRMLRASLSGGGAGRRRIQLHWEAPRDLQSAPVARYLVAVVDPAYGRALTVAQLEPDYSQELRRFLPIEELTSYVLSEEELQKMPRFWQQQRAMVQVAACNDAGQSSWAIVEVPLRRS